MDASASASAAAAGGRMLLAAVEEASLEEILDSLRASLPDPAASDATPPQNTRSKVKVKTTHMDELDRVAARHFRDTQAATTSISGRGLPLLYTLVSQLAAPPLRQAVLVVDLDGRFDATRLTCTEDDMRHVYVQRPAHSGSAVTGPGMEGHLRALVADAGAFMLYDDAAQASRARQWWGTLVVGGGGGGGGAGGGGYGGPGAGDVVTGWRGWLRVDRDEVPAFALGMSADEALAQRRARQDAVDAAGWAATSPWGGFVFHER
ncbi:peptidase M43, pregnancy-associated plasma-A [Purpureocillium lilacinum]|uniref:Peptidase M43, pregnancy-associated plasma-A n=1 Tax=Purpureocillium lilacinum TaxID=33203 RepID=A0A179GV18_PURLI|nr:peptidase M43, pregnancy-associated plasma-A [Purpureocillium lilacinum]OAQ81111.1 peptidase M43, pregnancy-associated plasma-A [Purpureocillium lilacinum]GJN86651.1 hypothetical protein PLIIFM63780_010232 [Purpureocillium lilacinum]